MSAIAKNAKKNAKNANNAKNAKNAKSATYQHRKHAHNSSKAKEKSKTHPVEIHASSDIFAYSLASEWHGRRAALGCWDLGRAPS